MPQWIADSIQKEVSQAAGQIQGAPCSQVNESVGKPTLLFQDPINGLLGNFVGVFIFSQMLWSKCKLPPIPHDNGGEGYMAQKSIA